MNFEAVLAVVRQDLLDVRRGRLVQVSSVLYVLFVGIIFMGTALSEGTTVADALRFVVLIGFLFVPLVSLMIGYLAIAGERESGTIRFLIGYPLTRSEVVLGKYLSRLAIITLAVSAAFVAGGAISVILFAEPSLSLVGTFAGLTLLFAASYVGIALGISTVSDSRRRAMTYTVAVYFVLTLLWSGVAPVTVPKIVGGALNLLLNIQPSGTAWAIFSSLSPAEAYLEALQLLPGETLFRTNREIGAVPVVVIMLSWITVPPLLGYQSFRRADID